MDKVVLETQAVFKAIAAQRDTCRTGPSVYHMAYKPTPSTLPLPAPCPGACLTELLLERTLYYLPIQTQHSTACPLWLRSSLAPARPRKRYNLSYICPLGSLSFSRGTESCVTHALRCHTPYDQSSNHLNTILSDSH